VVSRCPPNASLRVDCDSASAPFLCAGIEDPASLLTDLTVALSSRKLIDCAVSMASVLRSVDRTTRLRRFAGRIHAHCDTWVEPAEFAHLGMSLYEFLRRDSQALKSLIFDLASIVRFYRLVAAVSRQDLLEWDFAPLPNIVNGNGHVPRWAPRFRPHLFERHPNHVNGDGRFPPWVPQFRPQIVQRRYRFIFNRDWHPAFAIVSRAVEGLRGNRHLLVLDLCTNLPNGVPVPAAVGKEIVGMLRDSNTTLQRMEGLVYESAEHDVPIRHLLLMNRYGRDLVRRGRHSVPVEHWGEVLMRISTLHSNQCIVEMVRHALESRSVESPSAEPESDAQQR
jgi:hypothetical protein